MKKKDDKGVKYEKKFLVRMSMDEHRNILSIYDKSGNQSLSRFFVGAALRRGEIKNLNRVILQAYFIDFQKTSDILKTMAYLAYASVTNGGDFPLTKELEKTVKDINKITKVLAKLIKE